VAVGSLAKTSLTLDNSSDQPGGFPPTRNLLLSPNGSVISITLEPRRNTQNRSSANHYFEAWSISAPGTEAAILHARLRETKRLLISNA
jgi:hypothetical protein